MIESLTYLSQIPHSNDLPKNILGFQLLLGLRIYQTTQIGKYMNDNELRELNLQRFNRTGIKEQFSEVRDLLSAIHSDTGFQNLDHEKINGIAEITSNIETLIKTHRKHLRPLIQS
jgi:hypothetical protein